MPRAEPKFSWSVLPPVPLRGVGTALVESVEHYALRLAWIAGTTVSQICDLPAPFDEPGTRVPGGSIRFCGPGEKYKYRIRNLAQLTQSENISCGSFLILDELLAAQGSIGRDSFWQRWCPECFLMWDDATSWEPLIWQVGSLNICTIHGCNLENKCRKCHSTLSPHARYETRRICRACGSQLAGRGRVQARPAYQQWCERQVCELIELCATPGQEKISASAYKIFVNGLADSTLFETCVPASLRAALSQLEASSGIHRVTLNSLINLCALQGVSIVDVLLNPAAAASQPLINLWDKYQSLDFISERHRAKIMAFRKCMTEVKHACQKLYLPSMHLLLRAIKLNRDLARELSVEIYEEYEKAYREQGSQCQLQHSERAFKNALGLLKESALAHKKFDEQRLAEQVATRANVSITQAMRITKSALHCRTALNRINRIYAKKISVAPFD